MPGPLKFWLADRLGLHRLNNAVAHLLARDLNVLSALPEGPEGNRRLRDAFLALIPVLRPTVFCDIGAHDGSTALAVRGLAPECAVYGFEANPHIHARHAATMAAQHVTWLNIAVSDVNSRIPIFVPRTLSRAYVGGQVVPAHVVETEDTGKTSLLLRNEEATYDRFDVDARTLDDVFRNYSTTTTTGERRFFLWLAVEGAANKVLAGADAVLRETQAIFVETENFDFWKDQIYSGEVLDILYRKGFLPVARDREYGDKQFNMFFVRADVSSRLNSTLFDASSPLRACLIQPADTQHAPPPDLTLHTPPTPRFTSVGGWLQAEVPVLVPCFNNPTFSDGMLRQLRALGFQRITFVDNASTSPEMRTWLAGIGNQATVIFLTENFGPHHAVLDPRNLALLPQRFCLTDPDLFFNPSLPDNFLGELAVLVERHQVGKAGFALDISERDQMRDESFRIDERNWKIWEWEAKFWDKPLETLEGGDPVYDAQIDTTFALYDKRYFEPADHLRAVRVAGRFTARHLPWYCDCSVPESELAYYRRTEKFSYYLKDARISA